MRAKLERLILLAIHACDGMPMPEGALISAVQGLARPLAPTYADVIEALRDVEAAGFVAGASEPLMDTTWTLTTSGMHKARQLR